MQFKDVMNFLKIVFLPLVVLIYNILDELQ